MADNVIPPGGALTGQSATSTYVEGTTQQQISEGQIPPQSLSALPMPSPINIPQLIEMPSPIMEMPQPQLPTFDRSECNQLLSAVGELVSSIHDLINSNIKQVNDTCQQQLSQCQGLVSGQIGRVCDVAETALIKGHSKIRKNCAGGLGDAYGYAAAAGMVYPTADNVLYGLQTGDCINSMGCATPGQPQIEIIQPPTGTEVDQGEAGGVCVPPPGTTDQSECQTQQTQTVNRVITSTSSQDTFTGIGETTTKGAGNVTINETCPAPTVNVTVDDSKLASALDKLASALKPPPPPVTKVEVNLPTEKPEIKVSVAPTINVTSPTVNVPVTIDQGETGETTETTTETTSETTINNFLSEQSTEHIEDSINDIANALAPPTLQFGVDTCTDTVAWAAQFGIYIKSLFTFTAEGDNRNWPQWAFDLTEDMPNWIKNRLFDAFKVIGDAIIAAGDTMAAFRGCPNDVQSGGALINILLGVVNRFAGGLLRPNLDRLNQGLNVDCPTHMPSTADANKAYINNTISKEQWACWVAANNDIPASQWPILSADAQKISEEQALILYRWGKLDPQYFADLMRSRGWFDPNQIAAFMKASEAIPTPSDLITMMVRDVADPKVVSDYNLLDDFDKKWQGQLKSFGDAQGMSPEISKLHWAAHWQHPSPEQVFRMMRQLNPADPSVKAIDDEYRAAYESTGKSYPGVGTTIEDVIKLLEVNDYAWYWRARLAAISNNPLTRTDAQRAFQLGVLSPDQLYWTFRHEGYNDTNAKILVDFTKELTRKRKERELGTGNIAKWRTAYVQGYLSFQELTDIAKLVIPNQDKRDRALSLATEEKRIAARKREVDCVKHDVVNGIIDNVQGKNALINMGIDAQDAQDYVDSWVCKIKYRKRELTAANICHMRELGLITFQQQMERLINLGWTVGDAQLIAKQCEAGISERQQKKIIAALKQQQAAAEKKAKAEAAAIKQAQKDLKDQQKAEQKAIKDAQKQQQQKGKQASGPLP